MHQFVPLDPEREPILEVERLPFVHSKVSGPFCGREDPSGTHEALWLLSATVTMELEETE